MLACLFVVVVVVVVVVDSFGWPVFCKQVPGWVARLLLLLLLSLFVLMGKWLGGCVTGLGSWVAAGIGLTWFGGWISLSVLVGWLGCVGIGRDLGLWMGGWVDGWMGGWVEGWRGGWVDGWIGERPAGFVAGAFMLRQV